MQMKITLDMKIKIRITNNNEIKNQKKKNNR